MKTSEVRRLPDGSIDEILAINVNVHLEQMDDGFWWMGITHSDGTVDHICLTTKRNAKVTATFESDC